MCPTGTSSRLPDCSNRTPVPDGHLLAAPDCSNRTHVPDEHPRAPLGCSNRTHVPFRRGAGRLSVPRYAVVAAAYSRGPPNSGSEPANDASSLARYSTAAASMAHPAREANPGEGPQTSKHPNPNCRSLCRRRPTHHTCALGRTRTCDHRIRSPALYPAELRGRAIAATPSRQRRPPQPRLVPSGLIRAPVCRTACHAPFRATAQAGVPVMLTSQLTPNLSVSMPKLSPHGALLSGIVTLPPSLSLSQNPRSAASSSPLRDTEPLPSGV
jgi:hypothetical protein